jgi:hypothetical protein
VFVPGIASGWGCVQFYPTFKEELTSIFLKLLQEIEKEETHQTHFTLPA